MGMIEGLGGRLELFLFLDLCLKWYFIKRAIIKMVAKNKNGLISWFKHWNRAICNASSSMYCMYHNHTISVLNQSFYIPLVGKFSKGAIIQ